MTFLPGIYRISQWGSFDQPHILSVLGEKVTLAPPGAAPERDQEWAVLVQEDGRVAIQIPADHFPSSSLSFEGEAEEGRRIELGKLSDFPTRSWIVEPAPEKPHPVPYIIRVPIKDLVIAVSPLTVYPPMLQLTDVGINLVLAHDWVFELLRPINQ